MSSFDFQRIIELFRDSQAKNGANFTLSQIKEVVQVMYEFPLFRPTLEDVEGDDKLTDIVPHLKYQCIPQNKFLFHQGDSGDQVYFILKGKVAVFYEKTSDQIEKEQQIIEQINQFIQAQKTKQEKSEAWVAIKLRQKMKEEQWKQFKTNEQDIEMMKIDPKYHTKYFLDDFFPQFQRVNTLLRGHSFGETVTLDNHTRAASIFAEEELHVLSLLNLKYRKVFEKDIDKQSFVVAKMLQMFPITNTQHIVNCSYQFKQSHYQLNQYIFRPGEHCQYIYLIKQGNVQLKFEGNLRKKQEQELNVHMTEAIQQNVVEPVKENDQNKATTREKSIIVDLDIDHTQPQTKLQKRILNGFEREGVLPTQAVVQTFRQFFGMEDVADFYSQRTFSAKSISARCSVMKIEVARLRENKLWFQVWDYFCQIGRIIQNYHIQKASAMDFQFQRDCNYLKDQLRKFKKKDLMDAFRIRKHKKMLEDEEEGKSQMLVNIMARKQSQILGVQEIEKQAKQFLFQDHSKANQQDKNSQRETEQQRLHQQYNQLREHGILNCESTIGFLVNFKENLNSQREKVPEIVQLSNNMESFLESRRRMKIKLQKIRGSIDQKKEKLPRFRQDDKDAIPADIESRLMGLNGRSGSTVYVNQQLRPVHMGYGGGILVRNQSVTTHDSGNETTTTAADNNIWNTTVCTNNSYRNNSSEFLTEVPQSQTHLKWQTMINRGLNSSNITIDESITYYQNTYVSNKNINYRSIREQNNPIMSLKQNGQSVSVSESINTSTNDGRSPALTNHHNQTSIQNQGESKDNSIRNSVYGVFEIKANNRSNSSEYNQDTTLKQTNLKRNCSMDQNKINNSIMPEINLQNRRNSSKDTLNLEKIPAKSDIAQKSQNRKFIREYYKK